MVPGAANVETFAITSDHRNLVKYKSARDNSFRKVSVCIALMAEDAPIRASKNWEKHEMIVGISPCLES